MSRIVVAVPGWLYPGWLLYPRRAIWYGKPSAEMETAVADLLDRITISPNQCGGRPCIRGMRIRVIDVLGLLAAGHSREEILRDYPYLEPDDIAACLTYAARRLDPPTLAT